MVTTRNTTAESGETRTEPMDLDPQEGPSQAELQSETPQDIPMESPVEQGDSSDNDSTKDQYQDLVKQVQKKRRREAIASLQRELDGDPDANLVTIEGAPHPAKVQARTDPVSESVPKFQRMVEPAYFGGRDLKELEQFEANWEAQFRANPWVAETDERRVAYAAQALKGTAMLSWHRKQDKPTSYTDFLKWCRDIVRDPENRKANAMLRLKSIKQGDNQNVRDLAMAIDTLYRDIGDLSDEERRAWTFVTALKDTIRIETLKEMKVVTSRDGVLATAQRHEEIMNRGKAKPDPGSGHATTLPSRPKAKPVGRWDKSKDKQPDKSKPSRAQMQKDGVCFYCQKTGHVARDCQSRDKDKSKATDSQPDWKSKK